MSVFIDNSDTWFSIIFILYTLQSFKKKKKKIIDIKLYY